jgi:hypothetical protein
MQDNFNLAKYLRHGNKLLNENIGGYVDIKPINRLSEAPMGDDMVTIELDMAWDDDQAAQAAFDQFGIEVQPTGGNPGTFEVTGRKEDILAYLKSKFYDMDDEDIATYYPELLDGEANNSMSLEELMGTAMEIEEIENYATDDSEDEKGFLVPGSKYEDDVDPDTGIPYMDDEDDSADMSNYDYMDSQYGLQVAQLAKEMIDDGFEADDAAEFFRGFAARLDKGGFMK